MEWPIQQRWLTLYLLMGLLPVASSIALANSAAFTLERLESTTIAEPSAVLTGRWNSAFRSAPIPALQPDPQREVWYRFRLNQDWANPDSPLLVIFDPAGLHITAFQPPEYQAIQRSIYDEGAITGFTRHAIILQLPRALKTSEAIYLRVAPARALARHLEITELTSYRARDLNHARLGTLFPAIQLSMALVMLCFFIVLRERVFLYYAGYVCCVSIYILYALGDGYELPGLSAFAMLEQRPAWFTGLLAITFWKAFAQHFLSLRRWSSWLERLLFYCRWPYLILAICTLIPSLSRGYWIEDTASSLLLVTTPFTLMAALLAWVRGHKHALFFLLAWVPALLLLIVHAIHLRFDWARPSWLEYGLPAALVYASIAISLGLAYRTLTIRRQRDVANHLAAYDTVTGVLNRRAILARLRSLFNTAQHAHQPLSLLFLDLDHFKQINDRYGHVAGDKCLKAVASSIASELRQGDTLGRYGGDEFLVLLPGTGKRNALSAAERIRKHVEKMQFIAAETVVPLTVSIGVTKLDESITSIEQLIACADAAQYRSKAEGRNRVSLHVTESISSNFLPAKPPQ